MTNCQSPSKPAEVRGGPRASPVHHFSKRNAAPTRPRSATKRRRNGRARHTRVGLILSSLSLLPSPLRSLCSATVQAGRVEVEKMAARVRSQARRLRLRAHGCMTDPTGSLAGEERLEMSIISLSKTRGGLQEAKQKMRFRAYSECQRRKGDLSDAIAVISQLCVALARLIKQKW
jgi:hypothetical protein